MKTRTPQAVKTNDDVRERPAPFEACLWHVAFAQSSDNARVATEQAIEKVAGDLKGFLEAQNQRNEEVRLDLIKWSVGSALMLGGLAFTAARYAH
jgi:hypothetical protein